MLRGIRTASANWLGRIVMGLVLGLIAISFAVWGIGDIFRGFGQSSLARIGGTEITVEQFRQLYTERLQQMGRQLGRPVSMDQARALGIDRQLVGQLIAEATLDQRVRRLRLGISDAEMARRITADPSLRGPDGRFDRQRFEMLLRQAQTTEQRYVADQRRQMLRRQLAGTVLEGTTVPKALLEAADRYQNEQRTIEYVVLTQAQAGDIPEPTPEVLAKYYEDRKGLFRAPEYRKIVVLPLLPQERAAAIEISEADLKKAYEERRAPLRHARAPHGAADRVQRSARGEEGIGADCRGRGLSRHRQGARPEREGHRSRHAAAGRHRRQGGRRGCLCAQGERGQRPRHRPLWHHAPARAQDRAREAFARSRRSLPSSSATSRPSVPRRKSSRSTTRSRTSARSAGCCRKRPPI